MLKEKTDFLSLISTFYYINLIINIIFAFKQKESSILFPIGLLLFACCDLQVGLIVLNSSYITIENNLILSFIEIRNLIYRLAEVENSVFKLAIEIKKTQKRANALDKIQIPRYRVTIKYIDEVLQEKEREDFFRLKRVKGKSKAKKKRA